MRIISVSNLEHHYSCSFVGHGILVAVLSTVVDSSQQSGGDAHETREYLIGLLMSSQRIERLRHDEKPLLELELRPERGRRATSAPDHLFRPKPS